AAFQGGREAALVAVESGKESGGEADAPACRVAVRRLDLNHVGAEIGEDQACARPHDRVAEFEYANAGKGEGGCYFAVVHCPLLAPLPAARGEAVRRLLLAPLGSRATAVPASRAGRYE